ncbi:MAG: sulfotransferase domain-containing protein, partial [Ardenticatenaceae bacterium]
MSKPNFYIIGAPKCGTTSLAAWLAGHPQIYMSPRKEPHFFNTDHSYVLTPSLREYERLFSAAGPEHVAVGEGSVWYLYSEQAVANILEYAPDARFVVCLRNPVEMAPSLYEQQVFSGNEHVESFEEAWRLQEQRLAGKLVTRWCREPRYLAYGHVCSLGSQLEKLYDKVERAHLLPLVLDDIKEDPRTEYLKVLDLLGVRDDGRSRFPVHNLAKERRSPLVRKAVMAV